MRHSNTQRRVQAAVVSYRVGDLVTYPSGWNIQYKIGVVMEFIPVDDTDDGLPRVEVMDSTTAKLVEVLRDQCKKVG
jgi:hypothetical protein